MGTLPRRHLGLGLCPGMSPARDACLAVVRRPALRHAGLCDDRPIRVVGCGMPNPRLATGGRSEGCPGSRCLLDTSRRRHHGRQFSVLVEASMNEVQRFVEGRRRDPTFTRIGRQPSLRNVGRPIAELDPVGRQARAAHAPTIQGPVMAMCPGMSPASRLDLVT